MRNPPVSGSTYEVWDLAGWSVVSQEARGLDPKDWVAEGAHAHDDSQSALWLFKPIKKASYRRCDDWSEKLASELARRIGLPAARVELAARAHEVGIISRNVTPDDCSLESGDTLLSEYPGHVSCAGENRPSDRIGHNLDNIADLLGGVGPPRGSPEGMTGFDVFAGYLVFDAWIANTDRHAINWGVLIYDEDGHRALAPSFDHGSALASGVQDDFLSKTAAADWARKGRAHRFEGGKHRPLSDLADDAIARAHPRANQWVERIDSLDASVIEAVVNAIPDMSEVRRRFLITLLKSNRRRPLA